MQLLINTSYNFKIENSSDDEIISSINIAVKKKNPSLGGHQNAADIAASPGRPMILIGG